MIDVVTNLLGEIVEIYTSWNRDGNYNIVARGTVRAVYFDGKALQILVEHNLGVASWSYNDLTKDGGMEAYPIGDRDRANRVRVVQRCHRCCTWDQKSLLVGAGDSLDGGQSWSNWEHRNGEGCWRSAVDPQGDVE